MIKSMPNIVPVNGHLIVRPQTHKSLLPTENGTFDELGIVLARPWWNFWWAKRGDEVWFDSWLAAKHPTGENDEYVWLIRWQDVRAKRNGI